jgi:hypothetical protein
MIERVAMELRESEALQVVAKPESEPNMATQIKSPSRAPKSKPPRRRRWRAGLAFGSALILVLGTVGVVALLRGNAEDATDIGGPGAPPATAPLVPTPPAVDGAGGIVEPDVLPAPGDFEPPMVTAVPEVQSPTTETVPFIGVVSLDPTATEHDWAQPTLAFDADGRPQVLYLKARNTVGLVVCDDPECNSSTIHEVFSSEWQGKYEGLPRPGSGPLIWSAGEGDIDTDPPGPPVRRGEMTACHDEACAESTTIELNTLGATPPAMATDSSGQAIIVSTGESFGAWIMRCTEPSCTVDAQNRLLWQAPPDFWGGPSSVVLRDGLPVLALRTADGFSIGRCAEPDCASGIEFTATVPIEEMVRGPLLAIGSGGAPIALVFTGPGTDATTWFEGISVAACTDAACTDAVVTEITQVDDMYAEFAAATGPDGRLRVAWAEDGTVFFAACHDDLCTKFSLVETGHPASDVSLAFAPDGTPVVAATSPQRGLEILFCGDDSCDIANGATP